LNQKRRGETLVARGAGRVDTTSEGGGGKGKSSRDPGGQFSGEYGGLGLGRKMRRQKREWGAGIGRFFIFLVGVKRGGLPGGFMNRGMFQDGVKLFPAEVEGQRVLSTGIWVKEPVVGRRGGRGGLGREIITHKGFPKPPRRGGRREPTFGSGNQGVPGELKRQQRISLWLTGTCGGFEPRKRGEGLPEDGGPSNPKGGG